MKNCDRVMGMAAAAALALPLTGTWPAMAQLAGDKPCVPIPVSKIAIQTYSLPGLLQADAAIANVDQANAAAMARLAAGGAPRPRPVGGTAVARPTVANAGPASAGPARAAPAAPGGGRVAGPPNPVLVDSTFARLRQIGYQSIETAGHFGLTAEQMKAALDRAGLKMIGGHDNLAPAGFDAVMDYAIGAGQTYYVGSAGWGPVGGDDTLEHVQQAAANLNALGKRALDRGLHLYVHNHEGELTPIVYDIHHDGKPVTVPAWEVLADLTDPRYLNFEIDIHWLIEGFGGNEEQALAFTRKHKDRIILYHVKETLNKDGNEGEAYVGQGMTHWSQWWAAAPNVKYYIYEYDNPPDALEGARTAFNTMACRK